MRIRVPLIISVGLILPMLLASPASAKAMPEFIVSGGGLERPVYVSADEVVEAVRGQDHGWVMGGGEGAAGAPQQLGKRYDLDVLQFQFAGEYPSLPSQRTVEGRWAYYPEGAGAVMPNGDWVPFSPTLNGLLAARISEHQLEPGPSTFGKRSADPAAAVVTQSPRQQAEGGDVPRLAAVGAMCLTVGFVAGWFLKRRRPAPMARRGSPSPIGPEASAVA